MRIFNLPAIVMAISLTACVDNNKQAAPAETAPSPATAGPITGAESADKEYTPDVIRFTGTTKDLGTWGKCLQMSSWGEEANRGTYTFLCPTDEALELNDRQHLGEFKRPENKKLLDKVIARHLLKGQWRYDDLMNQKDVETIDGQRLKIDKENGSIDGVKLTKRFVASETLYLLVTEDLLEYPQEELKASVARNTKPGGSNAN